MLLNHRTENPFISVFGKSSLIPRLGLPILPLFVDSNIDLDVVDDITVLGIPPLSQVDTVICLS